MLKPELNWAPLEKLIRGRFYSYVCPLEEIDRRVKEYFIEMAETHHKMQQLPEKPTPDDIYCSVSVIGYHNDLNKANELRKALALSNQAVANA